MRTTWPAFRNRPTTSLMSAWCGPLPTTRASRAVFEPGATPSSATFSNSADGRLSTTNQPRSSRLSAACERPAPAKPAITGMSGTAGQGPERRFTSGGLAAAEEQQPRDGGGVGVLLGPGQEAG